MDLPKYNICKRLTPAEARIMWLLVKEDRLINHAQTRWEFLCVQ